VVADLVPDLKVRDANTGAAVNASPVAEWWQLQQLRARRRWQQLTRRAKTEGSWPEWTRYASESRGLHALWTRPSPVASDLFARVLGHERVTTDVARLKRHEPFLFVSMLTAKIWLNQRR
jgi:hypothetical protein